MLYMIIERFHPGKVKALYLNFSQKGRLLPQGVHYINSWVDTKLQTCYQVMESDSEDKLQEWMSQWQEFVDFEVIPVLTSAQARAIILED